MLNLLPRCSAPLRMGPGCSRWANKAPSGHHMHETTVALDLLPSCPVLPTPSAAQNGPAGSFEPPQSRQVPAPPRALPAPHAGPVPTCLHLHAGAGGDAGARPRRWGGCKRGHGERAEATAAGHARPWQPVNLPVALENSRKKSSSLCSPGLRCQPCLGPRQPAQPSLGRQHRRQPGLAQVG